jgi:hypothetical protein
MSVQYAAKCGESMSVLVEAITVIVRVDTVERVFPGGLDAFQASVPNTTFRSDGFLTAVGFMTPTDVEVFVLGLQREGMVHVRDGVSVDIAVADQMRGTLTPCAWLEVGTDDQGNKVASLRGASARPMAVHANWRPHAKLTFSPGAIPDLPIDEETGLRYMLDDRGQKLYLGQRFEDDDPQARLMLAGPRLLRFAKSEVWRTMITRGWLGLDISDATDPTRHLAMRFENQLGLIYVDARWSDSALTPYDIERKARLIDLAKSLKGIPIVAQCGLFAPIHMRSNSGDNRHGADGVKLDLGRGDLSVADPKIETLSFVDARTGKALKESKFDVREKIEISEWELLDFAVQVTKDKLAADGFSIKSWTTETNSAPHIVAEKDSVLHRVIVGPGRYPVAEPIYDQNRLMASAEATLVEGGFLDMAPVVFVNSEGQSSGNRARPLYRGEGVFVKFEGLKPVDPATAFSNRSVRLFISSTFKDFDGEREILAKEVLPELRRRGAERGVAVSLVDLRWGVPRSEVEASKEVSACIREIGASHPFFLALIGRRHGTLATGAALSQLSDQDAWLKPKGNASITELEVRYSMLKPNVLNPSAIVFARSKRRLLSKKGEPDVAPGYAQLLTALDERGYPIELIDDTFPHRALEAIWSLIKRHYPSVASDDAGLSSSRRHRQFAFHAASMFPSLNRFPSKVEIVASSWEACSIAGAVGIAQRRESRLVFEHFFSLERSEAPLVALNKRLLEFQQRTTNEVGGSSSSVGSFEFTRELLTGLKSWSARTGRHTFLILSEIDLLGEAEEVLIGLISEVLSDSFLATRVGDAQDACIDGSSFLRHYLSLSGKALDSSELNLLLQHPLAGQLSFLRFAADHLIDTATHADLNEELASIAAAPSFERLADVLARRVERLCAPTDDWRRGLEAGMRFPGLPEQEQLETSGLAPASYFRVQSAFAPLFDRWGDWMRMHRGATWDRLANTMLAR